MMRYAVSNDDGSVTIHVWAFDEEDAVYRVEMLTDSTEFRKVVYAGNSRANDPDVVV